MTDSRPSKLDSDERSPVSVDQCRQHLVDSQLMSDAEIATLLDRLPAAERPQSGQELARHLVRLKRITEYQAMAVVRGDTDHLILNNYVLLEEIGVGGMGRVFKAVHRHMERVVALKLLPPDAITSSDNIARFRREVKTAAQLVHPNIVTAYDADVSGGTHYLIMEYVDGCDLSTLAKTHGPLAVNQAIHCIAQAAEGLGFAHDQGIVHRDVKPGNLLLNEKGVVKVLDLGLARYIPRPGRDAKRLTLDGQILGTFDYISPEQIVDPGSVDGRSDIYSLGCTLFAMLAGKAAYGGQPTLQKLLAHRAAEAPRLRDVVSGVPEKLDNVFKKMTAKRPDDRQQTMREVIEALADCRVPGEPSTILPPAKTRSVDPSAFVHGQHAASPNTAEVSSVTEQTIAVGKLNGPVNREEETSRRDNTATAAAPEDDSRVSLDKQSIGVRRVSLAGHVMRFVIRKPVIVMLSALLATVSAVCLVLAFGSPPTSAPGSSDVAYRLELPLGLPPIQTMSNNPMTREKVALGKELFFDKRLSVDDSVSCATCHDPARGWSDGKQLTEGINGQVGGRHSPTLINVAYSSAMFWDGRANFLEEQPLKAILNPLEMAMPSSEALEDKLRGIDSYRDQFAMVFDDGTGITATNVERAIAAFERTILSGDAAYDRYQAGDETALSAMAIRGMQLFFNKAHCSACHSGPNFSDGSYHNIGIGDGSDPGRQAVTSRLEHHRSFKTPTLREIARTAPYMHDGSLWSLADVVDFYNRGGNSNPQLDEEIFPLHLTATEEQDLIAFLKEGLTGSVYPDPR